MATSSPLALLIGACAVTLTLLHQSEACTEADLPKGCICLDTDAVQCTGLNVFPAISDTKRFFFQSCNFKTIGGENIPDYPGTEVLSLLNCKIQTIQGDAFSKISTSLQELELSGNFLTNISKEALFLLSLTHLNLERNELTQLPSDVFSHLQDLKEIFLGNNDISSLPDKIFRTNAQLAYIDISFAKLTQIPKAITSVPNLKRLIYAGNSIGPLKADMFKDLSSLEYMDISTCAISFLDPHAFLPLSKLSTLRLSSNLLREVPRDAFSSSRETLRDVWLDHNSLTSIENGTLPVGGSLRQVHLGFNPWHCDEKIIWLKDLHLEKIDHENVTCATPESLAGQPLANVTRNMLTHNPESSNRSMIAAAITIPIIVICIVVILLVILRMVQKQKQRRGARVRYTAVYKDTVESSLPGHKHQYRPTSEI